MARGQQPRKGDVSPRKGMGVAPNADEWDYDDDDEEVESPRDRSRESSRVVDHR
jgi:hypothetical protein